MSGFTVEGGRPVRGRLRMPGDKSISHRALLLAARAEGTSTVRGLSTGDDVLRTAAAVRAMGATVDGERIAGGRRTVLRDPGASLDLGNSGTGIRLLAGWCAPLPWTTVLTGDASIQRRPMGRVIEPLRLMGARIDGQAGDLAPLTITGGALRGIDYTLPVASAQVKSAVLLAGLEAEGETVVREPVPTRAHTEELLARCGADLAVEEGAVRVRPSQLEPFELDVPGDPSQAAFWVVAATIVPGSDLVVERVYVGPARAAFIGALIRMGARIDLHLHDATTADIRVQHAALHGVEIGGDAIPGLIDEIPVLAVAAAVAEGETVFRDAAELKVKESDRIATVTSELRAIGGAVGPTADGLVVSGSGGAPLTGGSVDAHGDHRIAMAMAVAGLVAAAPVRIAGWEAVATSYPGFEEDLRSCVS